jgi:cAMP-dependent protein kinase regulator
MSAAAPPKIHTETVEDDDEEAPVSAPPPKARGRRVGVAAESFDPEKQDDNREKVVHPKTEEQRHRLEQAVKNILLFRCLDEDQMKDVIDAMFERKVPVGECVIEQGQDGDNFYVIESGVYDIIVKINDVDTKVGQYDNKGSFGELALMYNTPRAATIKATTEGIVWAMDRETFRSIVLVKAFQKRVVYEHLLENVPMLKELNAYERMNVADALRTVIYHKDDKIISQGDEGKEMYFIEEGAVRVIVRRLDGVEMQVNTLTTGGYFGELALLTKHPRAASVYANEKTKLAVLDVESFERLLGPCWEIMQRNITNYEQQIQSIFVGSDNLPDLRK